MDTRDVLTQPSFWLDEDITAALRRAMESQRLGGAENLIRGEAVRFMQQQRLDEQRAKWAMVLFNQSDEPSSSVPEPETEQPEPVPEASSAEPPLSVPTRSIVDEIMMKYGLKKINHPPIVIAKPIPSSPGQTSETPASEQTSALLLYLSQQLSSVYQERRQLLESVPTMVLPLLSLLRVRKRFHQSKLSKRSHQYKPFQF